jgi:hypothetical protein
MKKGLLLILGTAFIASMCFTSCKKEHTCVCTYTDGTAPESTTIPKSSKKDAKASCDALSSALTLFQTGSCALK